jgi:hypothetical protein
MLRPSDRQAYITAPTDFFTILFPEKQREALAGKALNQKGILVVGIRERPSNFTLPNAESI